MILAWLCRFKLHSESKKSDLLVMSERKPPELSRDCPELLPSKQ